MKDFETSVIYRERRYWSHGGWMSWFEACPIVRHTPKLITVQSQDFPGSPLYPGGEFSLRRDELLKTGKIHHSRHGESFWLEKPSQGDLFPSAAVVDMPCAVQLEAESMGWDVQNLNDRQIQAYLLAIRSKISLQVAFSEV